MDEYLRISISTVTTMSDSDGIVTYRLLSTTMTLTLQFNPIEMNPISININKKKIEIMN